jgi:phage terminase large subunit-like protein
MTDLTGLPNLVAGDVLEPYSSTLILDYEVDAGQSINKGDCVYLSADGKISRAVAAQDCIGIATKAASEGQMCPVIVRGRVKATAGGAITRGKAVYGADASSRVLALADINEGGATTISWTRKLGLCEQSASAADDLVSLIIAKG